jgi:N-acetylglucosaminyl-diphospho-decaprenol L-rhamnosyltransferase
MPHQKVNFQYYATQLKVDQSGKIPVLSGAIMAVTRDAMKKTGGFDPRYFMYSEDIDLSWQINKSGFEVWYNPEIEIIHFKGETARLSPEFSSMFFHSMLLFYKKHYSSKHIKPFFTLTLLFIKTLKNFSSLKYSIKKIFPRKDSGFPELHPDSSSHCIEKLKNGGFPVQITGTNSHKSFLTVSSKEINPDQIIQLLTTPKNLKYKILLLHEESGWLFQFNNKTGFIRTFKLTNVK